MIPGLFVINSLGSGLEKIIDQNLMAPNFFELISNEEIYIPITVFLFLILITFFLRKKIKS